MTDASSKTCKPKRRWLQFSLRTLLIVVTLAAGFFAAWRVYVEPYRRQRESMKVINDLGGSYKAEPGGPEWMRDWFGADNFQNIVFVDVADCDDPEKYIGQVASLPRLETLVVGGRNFTDEHLSRLQRLTNLSGLVLDSTAVTNDGAGTLNQTLPALAIHKSERQAMAAFQQLATRSNWTIRTSSSKAPPELRQFEGGEYFEYIQGVALGGSQVIDAAVARLKEFTNLQELYFTFSEVSDADLAHLKGLTNLQRLWLNNTKVSDAGLVYLKGFSNLRWLYIGGTQVNDAGLAHLKGLTNLRRLHLTGTQVSDAGLAHLKGLTNLKFLWLDSTNVTDIGLKHLKGLKNLQRLWLTHNQVSDAGLAHLKGLANLQWLDLVANPVSDAGLEHLKGLKNLRKLQLTNTQVTVAALRELQKALPNCGIYKTSNINGARWNR